MDEINFTNQTDITSELEDYIDTPKNKDGFLSIITIQAIICTIIMIAVVLLSTFAPDKSEYIRKKYQTLVSVNTETFLRVANEKYTAVTKSITIPKEQKTTESGIASESSSTISNATSSVSSLPKNSSATKATSVNITPLVATPQNATLLPVNVTIAFSKPLKSGGITSNFGQRIHPITNKAEFHTALDISSPEGAKIYAATDGTVTDVGYNEYIGNYIYISHADSFSSKYGHLSKIAVKKGATVKRGEAIGKVGATGMATGPHLHFELRKGGIAFNPLFVLNYA